MYTFIAQLKNLYHFLIFSLELIRKNLFLFFRLLLLSFSWLVAGIAATPLLSFFDEGTRPIAWYIGNIREIGGLAVCVLFASYLVIHILEKQSLSEIKRGKAEHKVRTNDDEAKMLFDYLHTPSGKTLLENTKTKLLQFLPGKKKDE